MSSAMIFRISSIFIVIHWLGEVQGVEVSEASTQLLSTSPSTDFAIFEPQVIAEEEGAIEEISTDNLRDEATVERQKKFSKLVEQFAKRNCRETTSNDFATKNSDNNNALDETQVQFLEMIHEFKLEPTKQSLLSKLIRNKEALKVLLCKKNNEQFLRFNPIKAIQDSEHHSKALMPSSDRTASQTISIHPDVLKMLGSPSFKDLLAQQKKFTKEENQFIPKELLLPANHPPSPTFSPGHHQNILGTLIPPLDDGSPTVNAIPSTAQPKKESVLSATKSTETFEQTINIDIEDISQRFDHLIASSDNLIFMIHRQRAHAFSKCCQMKQKPDKHLLQKYVDAYSSSEEQDKIIADCHAKLIGSDQFACGAIIKNLRETVWQMSKYIKRHLNTTDTEKWFYTEFSQPIDVRNIVHDYHMTTRNVCEPAVVLLWKADKLVQCEIEYRLLLSRNSSAMNEYDRFHKEISRPFQSIAIHLMTPAMDQWKKLVHEVHQNNQQKDQNTPVPKKQIETDLETIQETLSGYHDFLQHPMTAHYAKRGHVYKVCCKPSQTQGMFNQHLTSFYMKDKPSFALNDFLKKCVEEQKHSVQIPGIIAGNDCTTSYETLNDAVRNRENFISKYVDQNPQMIDEFDDAIKLTNHQSMILQKMNPYVEKFCPEENLFELMFDVNKNIICQGFIHRGVGAENAQDYSYYTNNVSRPFQNLIEIIWGKLVDAVININTDQPKPATMIDYQLPPYNVDTNSDVLASVNSGASSMIAIVCQSSGILFLLMIQMI